MKQGSTLILTHNPTFVKHFTEFCQRKFFAPPKRKTARVRTAYPVGDPQKHSPLIQITRHFKTSRIVGDLLKRANKLARSSQHRW